MINDIKIKKKYVNSKPLFDDINEFIETGLATPGILWSVPMHRKSFAEVVNDWLEEFKNDDKITQYNVIADERVNPASQAEDIFNVHITYKQKHCLNTTSIEYHVQGLEDYSKDLVDWILYP